MVSKTSKIADVDLTLESVFKGDDDIYLLFANHRDYKRHSDDTEGAHRIFGDNKMLFGHPTIPDEIDHFQVSLFGALPLWYQQRHEGQTRLIHDVQLVGHEDRCDRCGCRLHLLNRVYDLCVSCDDSMKTMTDDHYLWSRVITPFTLEQMRAMGL